MNRYRIIVFLLVIISPITHAQTIRQTVSHDNLERSYRLFVPEHYDPDQTGQLIIVLHGGGMTALDMLNHTGQRFNKLIQEHQINAIVAYPVGIRNGWNDGRIRENLPAYRDNIDDVGFLLTLADTLATDYNIDPNALFVTGFSNGAGMSFRLACEQSKRITAIAPVANMMASTLLCEPEEPVAILNIMGDEDPIVSLEGGDLFFGEIPLGSVLSLDETITIWHDNNHCEGYATSINLPDTDPDDETTISIQTALDCDMPVSSMVIHGGGHTWAGSELYVPIEDYGRISRDINAGDVIFEFFRDVGLGIDQ